MKGLIYFSKVNYSNHKYTYNSFKSKSVKPTFETEWKFKNETLNEIQISLL